MALLTIYKFPNPILKQVAAPVVDFDDDLARLGEDMLETMYDSNGIGLASIQVGVTKRVVVMDTNAGAPDESLRTPEVYVNPEIVARSGEAMTEEGCLSVAEFTAEVPRAANVTLRWNDVKGGAHEREFEGLDAICLQHELDHLNGLLFIDHLPPLKRNMVKKRLTKLDKLERLEKQDQQAKQAKPEKPAKRERQSA